LAKKGGHQLVMLGDSITQSWGGSGKKVWKEFWVERNAINIGVSGDRTQHVLWRLDHGLLDALSQPNNDVRCVVVMIGTNNSNRNDCTAAEIGYGTEAIVRRLRTRLPKAKVLLLATFPRGAKPSAQRIKNTRSSAQAAKAFADDDMVVFKDIGARFLEADGMLRKAVMPDLLHLNAASYRVWAEAIVADVDNLMKR
jgi:beta-glucosidase